jgi:hypothetical protein
MGAIPSSAAAARSGARTAASALEVDVMKGALFLRKRVLSPAECARWTRAVYDARAEWTPCFEGVQFTLGRAYYTHREEGREAEYFAGARDSDARIERILPGLQGWVRQTVAGVVGGPVVPRRGWCGPGIHVFPAGDWLSQHGGDIHFDTEGLEAEDLARRRPALSAIVMLQPPADGGGLRLWDALWTAPEDEAEMAAAAQGGSVVAEYQAGDLMVIDSYRLHQIQPFTGPHDRVSVTAHLVFSGGAWQSWF